METKTTAAEKHGEAARRTYAEPLLEEQTERSVAPDSVMVRQARTTPASLSSTAVLTLQRTVGNHALAHALGRNRRAPRQHVRPPLLSTTAPTHIQRAPGDLMSADDLRKRGGKAKNKKKGGLLGTCYGKVLGGLESLKSQTGEDYAKTVDELRTNTKAWQKKHWFQNFMSRITPFGFKKAKGMRQLSSQLDAPEMKTRISKERFWGAINNPDARTKQEELEQALPSVQEGGEDVSKLGAGSSNKVFSVKVPTPIKTKDGWDRDPEKKKGYAYRLNITTNNTALPPDESDMRSAKKEYNRTVYLPLLARGLGLSTVAQSVQTIGKRGGLESVSELAKGKNLLDILKGKDASDVIGKINDEDLQETMLFDMVFQAGDAHLGNYVLSEEDGVSRLKRIDVDSIFEALNPEFKVDPEKDESKARAGSGIAGLPQANRLLSPKVLDKIKRWDPEKIRTAMENTPGTDGENTFDKVQIDKVVANIKSIRKLVGVDKNKKESGKKLSARELFNAYNREQMPDFDKYLKRPDERFSKLKMSPT